MSHDFQPVAWSHQTNIYEVNLRQYSLEGTFAAFGSQLPRLRDMGIEVLWFMPVTPISVLKRLGSLGSYYACSDYISTNPEFGTIDDFKKLVADAHDLGFKVIIDWVANHTGYDHVWTREHPDFYKKDQQGQFYDQHGWLDVIDLDFTNPRLRETMIESMRFWVDSCDIDGFRCDMAMLVPLDFWRQARMQLESAKKLFWLAECEELDYHEVFDAQYGWSFLHKMENFWRRETGTAGLDEVLSHYKNNFPGTGFFTLFTTNHDENSHSGSEYERLGDAAVVFEVLCCTWDAIPLIYSGQELPNYKRLRFFDKDSIEWTGQCALHEFYKVLLALRRRNIAMRCGDDQSSLLRLQTQADDRAFCFLRASADSKVLVILNLSADPLKLDFSSEQVKGEFTNVFTSELIDFDRGVTLLLSAWDYRVFEK